LRLLANCWPMQKFSLRCRTKYFNLSCFCWQIPKIFAARQNEILLIWAAFVGKSQRFSLHGRTKSH
jgi:hypothetical protein